MKTTTLAKLGAWTIIAFILASFAAIGLLCGGCTVTRVRSGEGPTQTTVTSYTVAYPWIDTTKQLDKAKLTAKTNASDISLTGYAETETASTNATAMLERAVGAAVGAAVKAVK